MVLAALMLAGYIPAKAAVAGAAVSDSIVYNGSFANANLNTQSVSGWNLNTGNANHKVTVQKEIACSNNALKIQATGRSYIYATEFSVESGKTYTLSYWVRVDATDGLRFAPFLNDSNYNGGWWLDYAVQPVQSVTDGWVKVSGNVTIPDSVCANPKNPQGNIQLGFMVYQGSGTLYLDDVSMVKLQINQDDPNLHFEKVSANQPQNWKTGSAGVSLTADDAVYHDGSHSMKMTVNSLAEKSTVSSAVHLNLEPGMIYEYSFWVCSQNASPTATVRMDMQLFGADGLALTGDHATLRGTTTALNGGAQRSGWTRVVTRVAVPAAAAYGSIRLIITRGSAELWIDDIFCEIVENGTDCVVYYEDFHAVDEHGNISTWNTEGNAVFTAENGGRLTLTGSHGGIYTDINCLAEGYTYCIKGNYTASMGGTVELRFYDYQHQEYTEARKTAPILSTATGFAMAVTPPSHTYCRLYILSDQSGSITAESITVYMTAQPPKPEKNYLDAAWTAKSDRENVVSSVEIYNGIPTLMIDGEPTAAHFYQRPDLDSYLQTDAESRIGNSGLELYITYGGNLYKGGCDPIWMEDGSIDYNAFDAVIYDTLAASDDALVMVNFGMFAPKWWIAQNPDHELLVHNGSAYIAIENEVSLASEKFRQEAGEVLRQLIRHMKGQPYYNRVFGIKISGGQSYEWMVRGTGVDQGPDYSPVSQAGFRDYLQKKYGTVDALRVAWGDSTVTFETAAAPDWNTRCDSSNVYLGSLTDGKLSRNAVDWNLWLNEASADSFLYYCKIAKEETDNQIIVGGYNGYLWTSNTCDSQGKAHTAIDRVLDSPYVDWIASPIAYNERLLGQSDTYMALLDSVQAHGKLYIAEQDNRTSLADSYAGVSWDTSWDYQVGQTRTMEQTICQQKRDFANALVNGAGLWQFDMYGGWLDDDQLYGYFADAKAEYDVSVHMNRDVTNEVAVFVGDESYAYLTAGNGNVCYKLLEPMLLQQRKHLAAMGAGYDTYAMSTLLEGKVPPHRLNIILSPFEITDEMQSAIDTYLKTNNQVVVWVYLPGVSDGTKLSLSNVEWATGFSLGALETKSTLQVQLADTGHALTEGISGLTYGNSVADGVSPLTYIRPDADTTVLGYNLDGDRMPGLAVKNMGDWISVYSAAPCLDVSFLRNLLAFAGCHSYSENNADIIYSSNCYVALHSAVAGQKTIQLPGNYAVYDVFSESFISMDTDLITYYHQANDTHLFRLMPANTYAVTASVQGGKGTLSSRGLTYVAADGSYSLWVTPETGYAASLTVNGNPVALDGDGKLTIAAVRENMAIEVIFSKQKLLDNWGFELGALGGSMSGQAQVVSDSTVHTGLYSLRLNHDGTDRDLVQMNIPINSAPRDREIMVTFWARLVSGAKTRTINTAGYCFYGDYSGTKTQYGAKYPERDGVWRQYTETYILPAGYEIFEFLLYTGESGTDVYIDDISITCEGQQMLINGGFERGNLTGSYSVFENTPEVVKAQNVHSGSYSAQMSRNSRVTATVTDMKLTEENRLAFSWYLRVPENTGADTVYYEITCGDKILTGMCMVSADGLWHKQEAIISVPAGTEQAVLSLHTPNSGTNVYLDDVQAELLPLSKIDLQFQEIFSDGTWRLTSDDMGLLTEKYYKIPVVLDGKTGFVPAHNVSGMLCIYPNFFSVYGCAVPATSFEISVGAVIVPVSPDLQWGEVLEGERFRVTEKVEKTLSPTCVKQWNLSLGDDIGLNFYVQMDDSLAQNAVMHITVDGKTTSISAKDVEKTADGCYLFKANVAAAQMTAPIQLELLSGSQKISGTYSVKQYADTILSGQYDAATKELVRNMLNYGGKAQSYFAYNTGNMADADISVTPAQIPTDAISVGVTGKVSGISFYGASLLFESKTTVRYYFSTNGNIEDYTFTVAGQTYTPVEKNGLYYVDVDGINPQDLDTAITVQVTDGTQELHVTYNPMSYITRMYNGKGSESLKALLQAMYGYHLAAKDYVKA